MNKLFLVPLLVSLFVMPVFAQTNKTALDQVTATAKESISTNLNEVIVDILRGVKTAGGEVYQASKQAITKSVDFTMEQAPLVVKEFLTWKLSEAVLYSIIWAIPPFTLFYLARVLRKRSEDTTVPMHDSYMLFDRSGSACVKWILRLVGIVLLMINLGTNSFTIAKITLAPRVFLIEYVVDAMSPSLPCGHKSH